MGISAMGVVLKGTIADLLVFGLSDGDGAGEGFGDGYGDGSGDGCGNGKGYGEEDVLHGGDEL